MHDPILPAESVTLDGQVWYTTEAVSIHLDCEPTTVTSAYSRHLGIMEALSVLAVIPGMSRIKRRLFSEEAVYQLILLSNTDRAFELRAMMLRRLQELQAAMASAGGTV